MKITANLIAARPRLELPLAAGLWVLSFVLLVVAATLVVNTVEMSGDQPQLEQRLSRISEQLKQATPREPLPPAAELETTRQRIAALNALTGVRAWSTSQLLSWLESRLPDNVQLVSLHHKPRDGEILLVAESPSAEALTAFLLKFEKEPRFSEVLLSKQGSRGAPGATALQFEVRVRQKP